MSEETFRGVNRNGVSEFINSEAFKKLFKLWLTRLKEKNRDANLPKSLKREFNWVFHAKQTNLFDILLKHAIEMNLISKTS